MTTGHALWIWLRSQWAPPGSHWLTYFLAGMLGLALTILFIWIAAQGDQFGLPPKERLQTVKGIVSSSTRENNDTTIYLDGHPEEFRFLSKAGDAALVANQATIGRTVTLTVDEEELGSREKRFVNIFAISVEGRVIQSFQQVTDHWRANNRVDYWLIVMFGPISVLCLVAAWRLKNRASKPAG